MRKSSGTFRTQNKVMNTGITSRNGRLGTPWNSSPWRWRKGYLRYRIGKCHAHGHGTEQNYEESARWFRQAVEDNNPFAAYSLGGQYLRGQGVEQSSTEAYRLYTMAAVRGNAYAQYQLGRMYRDGIGTGADLEDSKRWYAKAYAGFLTMEATIYHRWLICTFYTA